MHSVAMPHALCSSALIALAMQALGQPGATSCRMDKPGGM